MSVRAARPEDARLPKPSGADTAPSGVSAPDPDIPSGPRPGEEEAFLASGGRISDPGWDPSASKTPPAADEGSALDEGLPSMDVMKKRISPDARKILEELFRAEYRGVRRIPPGWLDGGGEAEDVEDVGDGLSAS